MQYHVYILYSKKLNRFYVGQTSNLNNRLIEHNTGESPYTSAGIPWTLVWSTSKPSFRAAEIMEDKLKNLSRSRKIKFMRKYAEGIADEVLLNELST
jgi:putative endonuclease